MSYVNVNSMKIIKKIMKWIMSKVKKFFTDLMITTIIGIEWCIFIGLYSAVELFNKIFKK